MSQQVVKRPHKFVALEIAGGAEVQGSGLSGLTAQHTNAAVQQAKLRLNNFPITITDNGTAGGAGSDDIFQFPEGNLLFLGAVADIDVVVSAGIGATAVINAGIGTAAANADASLTTTEQDLAPTAATTLAASAGATNLKSTSTEAPKVFDGTVTAKKAFLNFAMIDASITTLATISVTGDIFLTYADLGDID